MNMGAPLGVGFIGAGPVVQTIHLPTLALVPNLFTPVSVMDPNGGLAAAVSARAGARHTDSLDEILADPAVDVIAVCSPQQFHAEQVIAAMRAGKKAVLCEKPLVANREDAGAIREAAIATGVPLLVGTMHVYDPAWVAVREAWGAFPDSVRSIRSSIVVPLNDRFEEWATQMVGRPAVNFAMPGEVTPESITQMFDTLVLGLAVHALPLVRSLLPEQTPLEVFSARQIAPFGYLIGAHAGKCALHFVGTMHGHGEPYWELEAIAENEVVRVRFTPSFVHGGSAVATILYSDGSSRQFGPYADNGYVTEWRALHRAAWGDSSAIPAVDVLIDDLSFVLDVARKSSSNAIEALA